jgi:urease accessory protein
MNTTLDFTSHLAHISPDHGLVGGLLHPLLGLDHLLAMVAVGLIAAQQKGPNRLTAPLTFMLAMTLGFVLAATGLALPLPTEASIIASVVLLGLAAAFVSRLHPAILTALIAISALAHGQAHGAEAIAPLAPYAVGMLLTTAALHAAGMVFARFATHQLVTLSGLGIAATGLVLAVA